MNNLNEQLPQDERVNKVKPKESREKGVNSINDARKPHKLKKNFLKSISFESIKSVIIFTAIVVSIFLAGFFLVYPQYTRLGELNTKKEDKNKELDTVRTHVEYLQNLFSLQDELEKNIEIAKQAITVEDNTSYLMNQLIQIAEESNVNLASLSFVGMTPTAKDNKMPGTVNVHIAVSGGLENVITFLKTLEVTRRVVSIRDVRYSSNSKEGESGYNLDIVLAGYYMPDADVSSVSVDLLVGTPKLEKIVSLLQKMKYYVPDGSQIKIGTDDPFSQQGADEQDSGIIAVP